MEAPQRSKQEEIKATIYALVQEKQKVLYDKEHIQQVCGIKGKNWVTRSVNLLIQEGAIRLASEEEEEYLICLTQECIKAPLEETTSVPKEVSEISSPHVSDPIVKSSEKEEAQLQPRLEEFLDLSNLSKRILGIFIKSQMTHLQTTFEEVKSFFGLSGKQLERALDELTFNQFVKTSNFKHDIEFHQESIEGIEHHLKKFDENEINRFKQVFQAQPVESTISRLTPSKESLLKVYESSLEKRKRPLETIKKTQPSSSVVLKREKEKVKLVVESCPISSSTNPSFPQSGKSSAPASPSPSTPRPFSTRIVDAVQPKVSQTLRKEAKALNSPKKWIIPTSDYSERFFLIYHQHLLELNESLNDMLTSNDTLVLVMSEDSGKRKINLNQLHLILTAPWKLETWKIPMDSEEESTVLNHAIVSELSLQLILHPDAQFFVLSNSEGFLTAIHHLKQRLKLKDDQIQLFPSFYHQEN